MVEVVIVVVACLLLCVVHVRTNMRVCACCHVYVLNVWLSTLD